MSIPIKKIAIVGPESTGKSVLSKALAAHYKTVWVPEVARTYLENLGRPYTAEDVEEMARLQLQTEDQCAAQASGILICDTNLLVIKIWMENAYGICPDWIAESVANRSYDLHLLTNIDLAWEPDPLREHPEKRAYFLARYESELKKLDTSWQLVSGLSDHRFSQAKSIIEHTLVF